MSCGSLQCVATSNMHSHCVVLLMCHFVPTSHVLCHGLFSSLQPLLSPFLFSNFSRPHRRMPIFSKLLSAVALVALVVSGSATANLRTNEDVRAVCEPTNLCNIKGSQAECCKQPYLVGNYPEHVLVKQCKTKYRREGKSCRQEKRECKKDCRQEYSGDAKKGCIKKC